MANHAEHQPHARPHAGPMALPFLELDLTAELERLHDEQTWSRGQNAKTLIKYDSLRVVLMALQAGKTVPQHKTDGRVTIHVLSGHVEVKGAGRTFNLRSGGLLAFDSEVVHD